MELDSCIADMYSIPWHSFPKWEEWTTLWRRQINRTQKLEKYLHYIQDFDFDNKSEAENVHIVETIESRDESYHYEILSYFIWWTNDILRRLAAKKILIIKWRSRRSQLMMLWFDSEDPETWNIVAKNIDVVPYHNWISFRKICWEKIKQWFQTPDPEIWTIVTEMIIYAHAEDIIEIIKLGISVSNPEVWYKVTTIWYYLLQGKDLWDLRELYKNTILSWFKTDKPEIWRTVAKMIRYTHWDDRVELIQNGIEIDDPETKQILYLSITTLSKNKQALIQWPTKDKYKPEHAGARMPKVSNRVKLPADVTTSTSSDSTWIENPLYVGINPHDTGRKKFWKTGSTLTLLLSPTLRNKVIVRTIKLQHFLLWYDLYRDYAKWQKAWFDYIPVEPILWANLCKNGEINISSGVLDISVAEWLKKNNKFQEEILKQVQKIYDYISSLGIDHGHYCQDWNPHFGNYCLRFWRKESGEIDFDKSPRVYVIDFDRVRKRKGRPWNVLKYYQIWKNNH